MTAIARILVQKLFTAQSDADTVKDLGLFCCVGLLLSLILMTCGLTLSLELF
jgi:hypothetical protein